ncbi:MAG: D-alanyl-D-alanine carboxypeptidase/D-alanyl-D-alanine-endopeptidase [bacterium]|nr:MAG: D-alanyl-D-alanine carboxypeptidase/D-alanyl-D-alanine-endopeptidase [bacterium]
MRVKCLVNKTLRDFYINYMPVFILLITISCTSSQALKKKQITADPIEKLQQDIEYILQDSSLYQSRVGIKIVSLDKDEILFAKNSHHLYHPASNMKLLTTATALKKLGPDYRFSTILYADSNQISNGKIDGDLYLKGYGNPDLSSGDLDAMIKSLREKEIYRITGDLVFDDSYFDSLYWGSGWMWDDASAWEFAPIHALSVNDNCVIVTVKPGKKIGDTLIVAMEPSTRYLALINKGISVDSSDTLMIQEFSVERRWIEQSNTIQVSGGMALSDSLEEYVIDVLDGAAYTATLFTELMKDNGIEFNGKIYRHKIPSNAQLLVKHQSLPLSIVVYNTNKISDNLSAEMILKTVGAEEKGRPGTAKKGISVIYEYLQHLGIDSLTYHLADGSGVSRYNIITPDLLIRLLTDMDRDFKVQAEFKTSLPVAGADGTLENRMREEAAENKLRAKTGTLRGVSSLSGYTTSADDEKIAFSIMIEHFVTRASRIRKIQDQIGDLISSFSRNTMKSVRTNEK